MRNTNEAGAQPEILRTLKDSESLPERRDPGSSRTGSKYRGGEAEQGQRRGTPRGNLAATKNGPSVTTLSRKLLGLAVARADSRIQRKGDRESLKGIWSES